MKKDYFIKIKNYLCPSVFICGQFSYAFALVVWLFQIFHRLFQIDENFLQNFIEFFNVLHRLGIR